MAFPVHPVSKSKGISFAACHLRKPQEKKERNGRRGNRKRPPLHRFAPLIKSHAIRGCLFMGTHEPRPLTSETCTVSIESEDESVLPWLESAISPEPERFGESAEEDVTGLHRSCVDESEIEQYDEKTSSLEYNYIEIPPSPKSGGHASSDRNTTPRVQATEPTHPPLFDQSSTHDLLPLRQESQDSAYASAMDNELMVSIVDVDLQATNIRARELVGMMRGRVLNTRRAVSEKRQELQLLREELRDATDKLMRAVYELMAQGDAKNLQLLEPQYQKLSEAQDALGPAEYAYDLLETRLSQEEEELEDEETNFYTRNNIRLAPLSEAKGKPLTPRVDPYKPELVGLPKLDLGGRLEGDYRTRLSEAEALKEQLRNLEDQFFELTEEHDFRKRHNLQLSHEKSALLSDFPATHQALVKSLEKVEDELYDLRDRCIEQNLFTEDDYAYEAYDAFVEEIWDSVNDARDRSPLYANYVPHEVDFANKQDYVNTWLLESMHESTVEIMRLSAFIHHEYRQRDWELLGDDWSDWALEYWDQDAAGQFSNALKRSTISVLLGGTGSSLEFEDWGFERGPIVAARSLSPQRDIGIDLAYVGRVQSGQKPVRRRKRAPDSRAHSV